MAIQEKFEEHDSVACQAGNMTQKPVRHSTSITEYVPGEVLRLDIHDFAYTSKARKHLRAFGNYIGPLLLLIWLRVISLVC